MRRIFTLFTFASILFSFDLLAQDLSCPTGTTSGNSTSTYNSSLGSTGQTFSTAVWGSTNGGFSYNSTNQEYQVTNAVTNTVYTITSPTYSVSSTTPLFVGAKITNGNKIGSYMIEVIQGSNVIACAANNNLNGSSLGVAASFSGISNQNVQFRFSFKPSGNTSLIFDNFYTNPDQIVLPVNFTGFEAKKATTGTQLTWKVGTEQNVKGYEVEKSDNGQQFSKIGFVSAVAGSTYTFTDAQQTTNTVYYRIKNVDFDGKFKYSNVISFKNGKSTFVLNAFPVPAKTGFTLQHTTANTGATIGICSADGKLIKMIKPVAGSIQSSIDLSNVKSGLLLVRFDNGNGEVETLKLVKQ